MVVPLYSRIEASEGLVSCTNLPSPPRQHKIVKNIMTGNEALEDGVRVNGTGNDTTSEGDDMVPSPL